MTIFWPQSDPCNQTTTYDSYIDNIDPPAVQATVQNRPNQPAGSDDEYFAIGGLAALAGVAVIAGNLNQFKIGYHRAKFKLSPSDQNRANLINAYMDYGDRLIRTSQIANAATVYQQAKELDKSTVSPVVPNLESIYIRHGDALMAQGLPNRTIAVYEDYLRLDDKKVGPVVLLERLGDVYQAFDNPRKAKNYYELAILSGYKTEIASASAQNSPDFGIKLERYGDLLTKIENPKKALVQYFYAVVFHPEAFKDAARQKMRTMIEAIGYDEAYRLLSTHSAPTNAPLLKDNHLLTAIAQAERGDVAYSYEKYLSAVDAYKQAGTFFLSKYNKENFTDYSIVTWKARNALLAANLPQPAAKTEAEWNEKRINNYKWYQVDIADISIPADSSPASLGRFLARASMTTSFNSIDRVIEALKFTPDSPFVKDPEWARIMPPRVIKRLSEAYRNAFPDINSLKREALGSLKVFSMYDDGPVIINILRKWKADVVGPIIRQNVVEAFSRGFEPPKDIKPENGMGIKSEEPKDKPEGRDKSPTGSDSARKFIKHY